MSESYLLNRENNSDNKIALLLNNQRIAGEFCDIKIIVNDIIFFAHSSIVINYSNYVKNQCLAKNTLSRYEKYSNFSLNCPLTVDIDKNGSANCADCVKAILNFMYLDKIEINAVHIAHLIELCMFLNIDNVVPLFLNKVSKSTTSNLAKRKISTEELNTISEPVELDQTVKKSKCLVNKIKTDIPRSTNFSIPAKNSQCKLHTCLRCNYQCYKPSNLLTHLRSSRFCQLENTCSLCLMHFDSAKDVMAHLIRHDHPKPFFCTSCDQRFQSKTTLSQHIPKHSKETPFVCPQCKKGFKWKHGLTSHLIIHSKEMKHLCDECGFSTAHAKTLRAHKLVHTGDLLRCPYPGCKHTSQRKENLKSHLNTHNKETPFVCEICGHKFSQSKNLKRHSRIHDPSVTHHQCPHRNCDFKSSRTDKLREHVIRQHTGASDTEKSHDVQMSNNLQVSCVAASYFQSTDDNAVTNPLDIGDLKNIEELPLISISKNALRTVETTPTNIYSLASKSLDNLESNVYKNIEIDIIHDILIKKNNIPNGEIGTVSVIPTNSTIQSFTIADEGLLDILTSRVD